ncbi:ArsR/SmtB family transcription factor [Streptomyces sp. NPDC059708]|uniref:ArsR/SmtB family transcription factor n=1 Tax=Streptomyces sp. NPDC059708 TaxID=3346916 RepID=UPI00369A7EF4
MNHVNRPADPQPEVFSRAGEMFAVLSSPVRLHLIWALAEGERDVSQLQDRVGRALPTVSQHLTQLRLAGLVQARRHRRRHIYSIREPYALTIVQAMLDEQLKQVCSAAGTEPRGPVPVRREDGLALEG